MKIVTIAGARPQFVKLAVVSRALREQAGIREVIVHTGQHYDPLMTDIFFEQLRIPAPYHHLGVGSGPHGAQTGRMLERIETVLTQECPDWVLVYGDTNSTLAGALAAAKCHVPVAHVEAGLRSWNRRMPEEVNRVLTDHVSDRLFAPTASAAENLAREGIGAAAVEIVGDVMYDAALFHAGAAPVRDGGDYALATVHRAENTDDPERLDAILSALGELADSMKVILPLHPRTRARLEAGGGMRKHGGSITFIDPVGYLEMIALEKGARVILTDSGGVQKEAYFFGKPCVILRNETEWMELVEAGWNRLAPPVDAGSILQAAKDALETAADLQRPLLFGDGRAGVKIARSLAGT
ncbi:MAG: non-hydrolyzing UDP-N-acetylglucosamine 2-epimerase [Hyphomicrobiales bacterium]